MLDSLYRRHYKMQLLGKPTTRWPRLRTEQVRRTRRKCRRELQWLTGWSGWGGDETLPAPAPGHVGRHDRAGGRLHRRCPPQGPATAFSPEFLLAFEPFLASGLIRAGHDPGLGGDGGGVDQRATTPKMAIAEYTAIARLRRGARLPSGRVSGRHPVDGIGHRQGGGDRERTPTPWRESNGGAGPCTGSPPAAARRAGAQGRRGAGGCGHAAAASRRSICLGCHPVPGLAVSGGHGAALPWSCRSCRHGRAGSRLALADERGAGHDAARRPARRPTARPAAG